MAELTTSGVYSSVGDRLRAIRAKLGLSQTDMAARAGIPIDSYKKNEGNVSMPGGEALAGLGLMGIDLTWLLTGHGSDELALARPRSVQLAQEVHARYDTNEAYALIPLYDIRAAAGHGALVDDRPPSEHWAFSRAWLASELGVAPNRLALIPIAGNSMEPDLHDGDVVMIDRGDVEVIREGAYVFFVDDHLYVKRLELVGDTLTIISKNESEFPARQLNMLRGNGSFRLIGRVLGQPTFRRF